MKGKPFVKNDPRINRDGRPMKADKLRAMILNKLHQTATGPDGEPITGIDGEPITHLEQIIDTWIRDPKRQLELIQYAFGKPKGPESTSIITDWADIGY